MSGENRAVRKSTGVFLVLLVAGALWALSLADWAQAHAATDLGPDTVAATGQSASVKGSPVATACVAIIAVTGLLAAMLSRVSRFIVLGLAAIAALGYCATAAVALGSEGATGWPIFALIAGILGVIIISFVLYASRSWTSSQRYTRSAVATGEEFDSAATWDALSRGEDPGGDSAGTREAEDRLSDSEAPDNDQTGTRDP